MSGNPAPDEQALLRKLRAEFDPQASGLRLIGAGMFSHAYSFRAGQQAFVVRVNAWAEDFEKDAFASTHFGALGLPIPSILAMGRFDEARWYAVAARCPGRRMVDWGLRARHSLTPALFASLAAIHAADVGDLPGWGLMDAAGRGRFSGWGEYLRTFYNQKFDFTWDDLLARTFWERSVFDEFMAEFDRLLPFCPEEKYLVHGDYGFDNVIATHDEITGVLDWAEMRLGDFLYDVAWLDYWSPDLPYGDLWLAKATGQGQDIPHFQERMRCYMLHIGLGGMAIAAINDDERSYGRERERTRSVLLAGRGGSGYRNHQLSVGKTIRPI